MALFTSAADADLPKLTRFYQLDGYVDLLSPKIGFEDVFQLELAEDLGPNRTHIFSVEDVKKTDVYAFFVSPTTSDDESSSSNDSLFAGDSELLQSLPVFHYAVRKLMESFADNGVVHGGFLHIVNFWMNRCGNSRVTIRYSLREFAQSHPDFPWAKELLEPRKDDKGFDLSDREEAWHWDSIPVGALRLERQLQTSNEIMVQLIDELTDLLRRAPESPQEVVQRCQECDSPFVLLRKGQVFCSHRCGSRSSARNRRREVRKIVRPRGRPNKNIESV